MKQQFLTKHILKIAISIFIVQLIATISTFKITNDSLNKTLSSTIKASATTAIPELATIPKNRQSNITQFKTLAHYYGASIHPIKVIGVDKNYPLIGSHTAINENGIIHPIQSLLHSTKNAIIISQSINLQTGITIGNTITTPELSGVVVGITVNNSHIMHDHSTAKITTLSSNLTSFPVNTMYSTHFFTTSMAELNGIQSALQQLSTPSSNAIVLTTPKDHHNQLATTTNRFVIANLLSLIITLIWIIYFGIKQSAQSPIKNDPIKLIQAISIIVTIYSIVALTHRFPIPEIAITNVTSNITNHINPQSKKITIKTITSNIESINNITRAKLLKNPLTPPTLNQSFVIGLYKKLHKNETIQTGKWFDNTNDIAEASIESSLAKSLNLNINDTLSISFAHQTFKFTITSIRTIDQSLITPAKKIVVESNHIPNALHPTPNLQKPTYTHQIKRSLNY